MEENKIVERRSLRHDFSVEELHNLSVQLAMKTTESQRVADEKKSVLSDYTAKLNEIKATQQKVSVLITNGFEYRDKDCVIEYNRPEPGKKLVTLKDENRLIGVEKMTDDEWNLFNAPKEDEMVSELLEEQREQLRGNRSKKKSAPKKRKK